MLPLLICLCLRRRGCSSWDDGLLAGLLIAIGDDEDEEGGAVAVQHGGHANFISLVERADATVIVVVRFGGVVSTLCTPIGAAVPSKIL